MKKVLATGTKFIFGGFGIAVLGLLMTLTYQALARIFPTSFSNQMWGLVLFDLAAMCWALAFVFASHTTGQYAISAIGFLAGFIGTLGMVAAEVILSSGTATDPAQIGQWMTYGFIIVTALHAALLYGHHAAAPDIREKIDVGIARGEVVTEAITRATKEIDTQKAELAEHIQREIVSQVMRDLNIPIPARGTVFEPKHATTWNYPYLPGKEPETAPKIQTLQDQQTSATSSSITPADIELAKRINPLAAPYRFCPKCDEMVPLTKWICPSCKTRMPDIKVEPRPVLDEDEIVLKTLAPNSEEKPAPGVPFQGNGINA